MTEADRQWAFSLAREYLEKAIYVDLGVRIASGTDLALAFAKLIETARSYYFDEIKRRGFLKFKKALAIFDAVVDDYIFGKLLDPLSEIQISPVKSPMKLIFGDSKSHTPELF